MKNEGEKADLPTISSRRPHAAHLMDAHLSHGPQATSQAPYCCITFLRSQKHLSLRLRDAGGGQISGPEVGPRKPQTPHFHLMEALSLAGWIRGCGWACPPGPAPPSPLGEVLPGWRAKPGAAQKPRTFHGTGASFPP